jgi:MurNAc alpha-1-phosphate uridylyltransferase
MKAMILAAGVGKRMRPLTENIPKPLLMLAGKPLIVHTILRCKAAGITDFVINVCYLADQIKAVLDDGSTWGVRIAYSDEQTPQGSVGGMIHALPLLGDEPFIITSADVYTDYNFSTLVKRAPHVTHAHLVMCNNPPVTLYHLNDAGLLCMDGSPKLDYAGFGIFNPAILKTLPDAHMEMLPLLNPYIKQQKITGEYFEGLWENLGTPEQYTALCERMVAPS